MMPILKPMLTRLNLLTRLFNQGLTNLNSGRAKEAARKFAAVDRQHPYSEYARRSIVLGAFANYRQGNYTDAIAQAKRYVTLYPTDKDAAYAQYIIGLSYWRQIPDVTRDQADSRRTIAAMTEVVERYPDSEYVEDAQTKIRFARDQIAGKENAGWPLLFRAEGISGFHQAPSVRSLRNFPIPGTRKKPWRVWLKPISHSALPMKPRRQRRCWALTSRIPIGMPTATSCCSPAGFRRAKTPVRGFPRRPRP